jgi:hypothetical protein
MSAHNLSRSPYANLDLSVQLPSLKTSSLTSSTVAYTPRMNVQVVKSMIQHTAPSPSQRSITPQRSTLPTVLALHPLVSQPRLSPVVLQPQTPQPVVTPLRSVTPQPSLTLQPSIALTTRSQTPPSSSQTAQLQKYGLRKQLYKSPLEGLELIGLPSAHIPGIMESKSGTMMNSPIRKSKRLSAKMDQPSTPVVSDSPPTKAESSSSVPNVVRHRYLRCFSASLLKHKCPRT